jgi:hypothetical protein
VGYTAEDSVALWDTMEEKLFCCGIQWKKNFCFVVYNRRKLVRKHPEIVLWCTVSHNGKKYLPLYPKTEENLFRCIQHQKKFKTLITARKNFVAKSILLMNQGLRWSSLMKKIEGEKSRGTIPLRSFSVRSWSMELLITELQVKEL